MPASSVECKLLDLNAVRKAKLFHEPYDYAIAPDVVNKSSWSAISSDFPAIKSTGSFPLSVLQYGPSFSQLCQELLSKEFEQVVAEKFDLELAGLPTMLTVRGHAGWKADGHIHTDSKDKVITVLLYLNQEWTQPGGRLRVLRGKKLDDFAAEIPPVMGQLLLFRRCDYSWHGHEPCEGERRSLQLNWVKSSRYQKFEDFRHKVSSFFKGGKEY
jgi:SM-20-related protein